MRKSTMGLKRDVNDVSGDGAPELVTVKSKAPLRADCPFESVTTTVTPVVPIAVGWQVTLEAFTGRHPEGNPLHT